MTIQPVILSGGSGTRLWPLSREQFPKQLLPLLGESTLLQETVLRLDALAAPEMADVREADGDIRPPVVVCNEQHRFLVAEQLRQLDRVPEALILEPAGRNTAPALTLAALVAEAGGTDPLLLVMPADHVLTDVMGFARAVGLAVPHARDGTLVTFGIVPTGAETGYGYIRRGAPVASGSEVCYLDAFVEKPDTQSAERYVSSREFYWNSGMFLLRCSVWLQAIERLAPDILTACRSAVAGGAEDGDFFRLDAGAFERCPSNSIDYAVMEKITGNADPGGLRTAVVPLNAGWSDVGAWSSLWEVSSADAEGNVVRGDVYAHETRSSLLLAEHRLVAAVGLENVIVVETADAVLVARRDRAQDVRRIVERLKSQGRGECESHRKVYRPWGSYEGLDAGGRFQVKRIIVKPGASLSLQMHHHRAEHWVVVRGTARVVRDDEEILLTENQSTYIPLGVRHRLGNPGILPLEIIEVQSGSYLGEDDIVRFEDAYGRSGRG